MTMLSSVRKKLRPVKKFGRKLLVKILELPYRFKRPDRGSAEWLTRTEIIYGGLVDDVARLKVSSLDQRSDEELAFGGMTGGDRMLHNGYAPVYAAYLVHFSKNKEHHLSLAEFGILKGTGLAIWCDLFPEARVIGLDIDPSHFKENLQFLTDLGAFELNKPEIHEYDQLKNGTSSLDNILKGQALDIVIDDGLHSVDSILMTWRSARPHLAEKFVYFIEDHAGLLDKCGEEFSSFDSRSYGEMTVITSGVPLPTE